MSRRLLLTAAGAAAATLAMPPVIGRAWAQPQPGGGGAGPLPTPDFSLLRQRAPYVVGVRPHRKGGVRLERDLVFESGAGGKRLIHNYGHGGGGITLSWGCAAKVADMVAEIIRELPAARRNPPVAVLGTGVIGLTVASELRRRWPRLPITVYAESLDVRRTVSWIAGGQFEPSGIWREYHPDRLDVLGEWLRLSHARVQHIARSGRGSLYGIAPRLQYTLDQDNNGIDLATPRDVIPAFTRRPLPFGRLGVTGREYRTWLVNPTILLPRLVAELKRDKVQFRARTFRSEGDVRALRETVIVNCTGMGARGLFGDEAMQGRRGHLIVLRNPRKLSYFFGGGCSNDTVISYMFARQGDIVVGGTIYRGDDRSAFDPKADRAICDIVMANIARVFAGEHGACAKPPPVRVGDREIET